MRFSQRGATGPPISESSRASRGPQYRTAAEKYPGWMVDLRKAAILSRATGREWQPARGAMHLCPAEGRIRPARVVA